MEQTPNESPETARAVLGDSEGPFFDLGMVAGSVWALLLFLALGLVLPRGSQGTGMRSDMFLLGCVAYAGILAAWISERRSVRRWLVATVLSAVCAGVVALWIPLARGVADVDAANRAVLVLSLGLVASGLCTLPCLGRVVSPSAPLAVASRMGAVALAAFGLGWVLVAYAEVGAGIGMVGPAALLTVLAGLRGIHDVPPERRWTLFCAQATGVGVLSFTLALVLACFLVVDRG